MERVVVDASVVVKWFIDEEGSDKALKIRDRYVNGEIMIIAPELLPYEVLNALRYSGVFSIDEIKEASVALSNYGIEMHPLLGNLAEKTVEISMETNITVYDSAYVALAHLMDTVLYTADESLIRRVKGDYGKHVTHISDVS
ncbi:MAG: type II toxin-antitoxin system VapC family toxin [Candidatus Asgardarchaeia archaeon]